MKAGRFAFVFLFAFGCASPFVEKQETTTTDGKSDAFGEVEACSWDTDWRFDTTADLEPFIESETVYRTDDAIPGFDRKQILDAYLQDRGEASDDVSLTDVFAAVDEGEIIVLDLSLDDGTKLDWVKWYGGDNEVGVIYQADSLVAEAIVSDGDFKNCGATEPDAPTLVCTYSSWVYDQSGDIETVAGSEFAIDQESDVTSTQRDQLYTGLLHLEFITGDETFEELFEATDDDEFYFVSAIDEQQNVYDWIKFYAGDTEVGVIFEVDTLVIVAEVGDGDVQGCTSDDPEPDPQDPAEFACSYDDPWETDNTGDLLDALDVEATEVTEESEVELIVEQQIYAATMHLQLIETDAPYSSVWDATDDGDFQFRTFEAESGDVTWVRFYAGDTQVGVIFVAESTEIVAEISDGDIISCVPAS
jgi:hypothetical protein